MKTVKFQSVIDAVSARLGMDPSLPENTHRVASMADMLNDALADAWTFYPWPDVVLIEERTPNGSKQVVYNTGGQTLIGEVLEIYREDPAEISGPRRWKFTTTDSLATITDAGYSTGNVWVQFRIPVPRTSVSPYNASQSYSADDVVYYNNQTYAALSSTTGNLPTNTTYWKLQEIPQFLAEHLKHKVVAGVLFADGQDQRALVQEQRAENALVKVMDDFWLRRGKVHNWTAAFDYQLQKTN